MRQRHCASEIHYAINQEVWSKINVHPSLFAWATIMSHFAQLSGMVNDLLSFAFCWPSKWWSSRFTVLFSLIGAMQVVLVQHASDCRQLLSFLGCLLTGRRLQWNRLLPRYPCSGSVQVAIWYCFVIKHRRRWLEVARGWFKPICRILAQLWDDSDLLWRCLINLN